MTIKFDTISDYRKPEQKLSPAKDIPRPGDHRGWIDYWHSELHRSLVRYRIGGPNDYLEERHIERSTRMLFYHGAKLVRYRRM